MAEAASAAEAAAFAVAATAAAAMRFVRLDAPTTAAWGAAWPLLVLLVLFTTHMFTGWAVAVVADRLRDIRIPRCAACRARAPSAPPTEEQKYTSSGRFGRRPPDEVFGAPLLLFMGAKEWLLEEQYSFTSFF